MADSTQSQQRPPYTYEEPKPSLASNILAIVGFIILIVVVIWGLVHLAGISRTWFSALFGGSTLEVTAPAEAISGNPFMLSWQYDEPTEGTFALLYQCASGLSIQTPASSGAMNGIPCGAAFTLSAEEKEVSLTPYLAGDETLEVPLTVIFMPNATGTRVQASATVAIAPESTATPTPSPTPTQPTPSPVPSPQPTPTPAPISYPSAPADLSVRIISVTVDAYGNGVATFDISNVGGTASGSYSFTASLPVATGYTYYSPTQASLAPGAHIQNTLRFSAAVPASFSVTVIGTDANKTNNYASQHVNAGYYGAYNSYYPQSQYSSAYYPQQPYAGGYGGAQYVQHSPYSPYFPYTY